MLRTIIAMQGEQRAGKTTSIRYAFEKLGGKLPRRNKETIVKKHPLFLKIDGVEVGFASKGDVAADLKAAIDELIDAGCKVIVCACRPERRVTAKAVESYSDKFDIVWMEKVATSREADEERCNQEFAQRIVNEVNKAVKKANGK